MKYVKSRLITLRKYKNEDKNEIISIKDEQPNTNKVSKGDDRSWGGPEGSLFPSYFTEV